MGKKKKNRKNSIFLNVNEMTIRGTGITLDAMEAHLGRSLIDYISNVNPHIFTLKELDNLCDDICKKLLNCDNNKLYHNILFIHTSSDSNYKKEFISFIRNMYKDKLEENKIDEIVYKFSNGIELYRQVIDRTIMSNKDINGRVVSFAHSVYLESYEIYNKLNDINRNSDLFNLNKKYTLDTRDKDKTDKGYNESSNDIIDIFNDLNMDASTDETLSNLIAKLDDEEFNKIANDVILDNKDEVILSDL